VKFGNANGSSDTGHLPSPGTANIRGYLQDIDVAFSFQAILTDTPMLMSINDLDALKFDLSTLESKITANGKVQRIERDNSGKPVIKWKYPVVCLLSDAELRRILRSFGHRFVDTVMRSLEADELDGLGPESRRKLQEIVASCDACQRKAAPPGHFSISGRHGGRFNHLIEADVLTSPDSDGNAIHITCVGSGLNAARLLTSQTAEEVWAHLRKCWIETYLGPPAILRVDRGTNLSKSYVETACVQNGINLEVIPTEAAWRVGSVERRHAPVKLSYRKIKHDLPHLGPETWLSMAVHATNSAVDETGILPLYAVFGAHSSPIPALSKDLMPATEDRLRAIDGARRAVEKKRAAETVERVRTAKCPFPAEKTFETGDQVLTYRKDGWTGPHRLYETLGYTDVIIIDGKTGNKVTLENSQVKHYQSPSEYERTFLNAHRESIVYETLVSNIAANEAVYGIHHDLHLILQEEVAQVYATATMDGTNPSIAQRFAEPRRKELQGLINRVVFELRKLVDVVKQGERVFKTKFVDTVKNVGTKDQYDKSRLVICAFRDTGKDEVLTRAPTVSRASTQLMLSIAASHPEMIIKTRDTEQAYTQSDTRVNRNVVVEVPEERGLDDSWVLILVIPLYGLDEARFALVRYFLQVPQRRLGYVAIYSGRMLIVQERNC
jgi:hypothetical protein